MCFAAAARAATKAELPEGAGFTEINKAVGAKWKALGDADKAPFHAQAADDKARFALSFFF